MGKLRILTLFAVSIFLYLASLSVSTSHQTYLPTQHLSQPEATPSVLPSPSSEQLEGVSRDLAEMTEWLNDEIAQRYKLCNDHSEAYLKLPLHIVDPTFRLCAVDLLQVSEVPVVLPPVIPQGLDDRQLHAYLELPLTNLDHYKIGLTWFPKEFYQANVAYFEGEKLTSKSPSLLAKYQEEVSSLQSPHFTSQRRESGRVDLARGVTGYYLPAACGANCLGAYSSIIWDQQGYRYRIAIKMGQKAQVVEIVNTAIENQ